MDTTELAEKALVLYRQLQQDDITIGDIQYIGMTLQIYGIHETENVLKEGK